MTFSKPGATDIEVSGIVQGVGFRPFIHQTARQFDLKGSVTNTSTGVRIHLEGPIDRIEAFYHALKHHSPPLVHITRIHQEPGIVAGDPDFSILPSIRNDHRRTLISPDVSVCDECVQEMMDPNDRRFGYPFINCTNCGPRYTIIDDVPYDRPNTSMKTFVMCDRCQAEYDNPQNRRFHAQPNACPTCGPHLTLVDGDGNPLTDTDPLQGAINLMNAGQIVAIKGLGGFHLACDAKNKNAVDTLRFRKRREEKPFAVMSPDLNHVRQYARVNPEEETLLLSHIRPIVLLQKNESRFLADSVAPNNRFIGVMLPYTPLHCLILSKGFSALVMTSGNISDAPIVIENDDAVNHLYGIADAFLVHDRPIYLRTDDSVIRHIAGHVHPLRRSRGYVPMPVFLKHKVPPILACGAEIKNTICLTRGNEAFVSQHIGDVENLPTFEYFQFTIAHLKRLIDVTPEVIAFDLHPDYLSSRYARMQTDIAEKLPVQHHHAHIAACMAENHLDGPVIGIACDGTGYGTDGTIWGCEILIADFAGFTRSAWLDPIPMPGGAAAIREPWRMALSCLYAVFGNGCLDLNLPFMEPVQKHLPFMMNMIEKRINSPLTSSLGRLFDSVAALTGVRNTISFEGQAAMELEMMADDACTQRYDYDIKFDAARSGDAIRIHPIISGIVRDLRHDIDKRVISRKFHNTVIDMLTDVCLKIHRQSGIDQVVLSGGSFQNSILLTGMIESLTQNRLTVHTHTRVPANDGGLSLGQAMIAASYMNGQTI
jgi:hydrogenase maturation protein HypF